MTYQRIAEDKWRKCHNLVKVAASIKKNAVELASGLKKEFGSGELADAIGLEFSGADDDALVGFESPVGTGRLRLEFRFQGEDLTGRYVVERPVPSGDTVRWEPVWAVGVGSDYGRCGGYWYGDDRKATFNFGHHIGSAGSDALFTVGMSIVAALIDGTNSS